MFKVNDIIICEDILGSLYKGKRSKNIKGIKKDKKYKVLSMNGHIVTVINDFNIKKAYKNSRFRKFNVVEERRLKLKIITDKIQKEYNRKLKINKISNRIKNGKI